jgi:hypothetical protein
MEVTIWEGGQQKKYPRNRRTIGNSCLILIVDVPVQLPAAGMRSGLQDLDGAPPCPNNTMASGGTLVVSAAVEGDHVNNASNKKNESRHSNDLVPILPKITNIGLQIFVTYTVYILET